MRAGEIRALAEQAGIAPGVSVLDLCCGVAGPGRLLTRELGCSYLGVDSSASAVGIARARAGGLPCRFEVAQVPPLPDGTFDAVTTGFCMRNVGDLQQALKEIQRVLKPGSRFVCLEFSHPNRAWLRSLYDWYSFTLLPKVGTMVAHDTTGVYEYLPASIRTFPDQEALCERLRQAGFRDVTYRNLTGGIVAIHSATK